MGYDLAPPLFLRKAELSEPSRFPEQFLKFIGELECSDKAVMDCSHGTSLVRATVFIDDALLSVQTIARGALLRVYKYLSVSNTRMSHDGLQGTKGIFTVKRPHRPPVYASIANLAVVLAIIHAASAGGSLGISLASGTVCFSVSKAAVSADAKR